MEAYGDFAQVYDEFMDNTPYEEWSVRLDELIKNMACPAPYGMRRIYWIPRRIWWWIWAVERVR